MANNFHEQFERGEAMPLPSNRSTGLILATALAIVAVLFRHNMAAALAFAGPAAALAIAALTIPNRLTPLTRAWMAFGLLLNKIISPVVMLVLFTTVIVPYGLAMQLVRDPLRRKARKQNLATYWIDAAAKNSPPADLRQQF